MHQYAVQNAGYHMVGPFKVSQNDDIGIFSDCMTEHYEVHMACHDDDLLMHHGIVTSLLANGSAAFKWKLHCHWLKGLWWKKAIKLNHSLTHSPLVMIRYDQGQLHQISLWILILIHLEFWEILNRSYQTMCNQAAIVASG